MDLGHKTEKIIGVKDVRITAHNDRYACVTMNMKSRESLKITG